MSEDLSAFIAHFNAKLNDAGCLLYFTRDQGLQKDAQADLTSLLASVNTRKAAAVAERLEDEANLLLGAEKAIAAYDAMLSMWILLKADDCDGAWTHLVVAQDATTDCLRAHSGFASFEGLAHRLDAIERLIFPPQMFVSAGLEAGREVCSICAEDYEECPHVVGRPYMGEFCHVTAHDLRFDHVAIVEDPASKHCRALQTVEDDARNVMTWRPADPLLPDGPETPYAGD